MLRGELHNRGSDGRCEACGEVFPCPDGIAIYAAVKRELEDPTPPAPVASPPPPPAAAVAPPIALYSPRWGDLADRDARCPRCLHWWVSHGVPSEDDYGCSMPTSSMDERERGLYVVCGCTFVEGNTVTPRQVRIPPEKP